MIIGILILSVFSILSLFYTYKSWIVPWRVKHDGHTFEPGSDDEVSSREMRHRSSWRYDSWIDRIMALVLDGIVIAVIVIALSGK